MKILRKSLLAALAILPLAGCQAIQKENRNCSEARKAMVTPQPKRLEQTKGNFVLTSRTKLLVPSSNKELTNIARYFASKIKFATNYKLEIDNDTADKNDVNVITFKINSSLQSGSEGYKLTINTNQVTLTGKSPQAIFHGVQTMLQLLPAEITQSAEKNQTTCWCLPCVKVEDEPRYSYRGMHLDVCRHFFDVDFIKKYIDYMAMYKMNTFHWHLTEDQGWRIEIKKYPKLTTIGATRSASPVYGNRNKLDGKPYGPFFYTQEEVKEIVKYAADRYITVIPEIELPGHSMAALAAYPHLGCTGGPYKVRCFWGVEPDVYCAGKESTFTFLQDVLDEVCELFPSKYIHIGGDECPKKRWNKCPHCQKRIKDEKLKNSHELQSYVIQRIEKYLNKKGRAIIGWDEILEGGLAPNATVMSWRGMKGGIHAANMGHDVVMSPNSHCYFDHYQGPRNSEPEAIGGFLPLKKVYSFDPTPANIAPDKKKHILGAQANMWSEYFPNEKHCEYMLMPRMIALAEVVWSSKESKNWTEFKNRLNDQYKRMDYMGVNYRKPSPTAPLQSYSGKGYKVLTNMYAYQNNAPVNVFDDNSNSIFWSKHSVCDEHKLILMFNKARKAKTVTVTTGKENGGDALRNGVLEISADGKTYKQPVKFTNGKATVKVNGKLKSVQVKVTDNQSEWLVIRSISIK